MTKVLVLSDLHLEFGASFTTTAQPDVVVLAGDISNGVHGVTWAIKAFPQTPVVFVPGNHEFYGGDRQTVLTSMQIAGRATNVHVLDRQVVHFCGVRFACATLWTDYRLHSDVNTAMALAQIHMPDHKLIGHRESPDNNRFTPNHAFREFEKAKLYLREALAAPRKGPMVVVTHHAPSGRSIVPKYARDPLNPAFASDLDAMIERGKPDVWIHGHIHSSVDYDLSGTRVLANPRGYPRPGGAEFENPDFNRNLILEL